MTGTPKGRGETLVEAMTVQDAITETVLHTPTAPAKAIAEDMGLALSLLYDIANPELTRRRLRAEEVPALVKASGNPLVLDVMEGRVGRVAFTLPLGVVGREDLFAATATACRELGDAVEAVRAAFSDDGRMSPREAARVRQEFHQAFAALARLETLALQHVDAGASLLRKVK